MGFGDFFCVDVGDDDVSVVYGVEMNVVVVVVFYVEYGVFGGNWKVVE